MPALIKASFVVAASVSLGLGGEAFAQNQSGSGASFIIDMPSAPRQPSNLTQSRPAAAPAQPDKMQTNALPPRAMTETIGRPVAIVGDGDKPDEAALRYYAQQNNMARVNTEIERLVRLYPNWTPPLDLFNVEAVSSPDEDTYWEMFAAEKLDELRLVIDARKREEPGWQPSKDLATKIRRKELRQRIMAFWKEGRWQDLVEYVKADGYSADDADVEILWTIAEAFAKTKQTTEALSVYASILNSSADQSARLATIQKAMSNLRMADVEKLIAQGRTDSAGVSEFNPILVDIVRSRISAYLHDERVEKIPEQELAVFNEYAKGAADPNQPGLSAWYYYKTKAFRQSLEWFKLALERGGDAMIAHGLAHSLRELDMRRETEEVAYAWREPLVNNLILFIDILERDLTLEFPPYIEPDRLARYAKVTMDVSSGEGAQALAWYAYNSCQYEVAHQWFQRAVAWFPKEATVYGYALTLQKMKKTKEFWDLMNRYDGLYAKVVEIIFPDGYYHPPTPCDEAANARLRSTQQVGAGYIAPGAAPGFSAPNTMMTAAQAAGFGAQYAQQNNAYRRQQQPPQIDRKLFPVSTDPENPLRYGATTPLSPRAPAQFLQAAADFALPRDPFKGPWPLVASRVPGVGPMPYERYGYALLAGWNGVTGPTYPTYAAQIVPKGTLWDTELPEKDRPKTAILAGNGFSNSQNAQGGAIQGGALQSGNGGADAIAPNAVPSVPNGASSATANGPASSSGATLSQPPVRVVGGAIGVAPTTAPDSGAAKGAAAATPPAQSPNVVDAQTVAASSPPAKPSNGSVVFAPDGSDPGALAQRAMQYFNEKNYAAALDMLEKRAAIAPETTELRMIRGWSLLHLQRNDEARKAFATLGKTSSGQSLQGGR